MNKIIHIILLLAGLNCLAYAGNLPVIGSASTNQVNLYTGNNFFLLPVSDGDLGTDQTVSISGISSNTAILSIIGVSYDSQTTFASIIVAENSIAGIVTVTIHAMDDDGTSTKEFEVVINNFYRRGANFKVYNLAHFLHFVPTSQIPEIDTIINQTSIPKNESFYANANLTEFGSDFPPYNNPSYGSFTDVLSGYIVPTISGTYMFKLVSADSSAFYLNTVNGANLKSINFIPRINCESLRCDTKEYSIDLLAGQYYPFKAVNWLSIIKNFAIVWSGPGINTYTTIAGSNLYPDFDIIKPSAPTALSIVNKGVEFLTLTWKGSTDNDKVVGYNVYVDGAKMVTINDSLFIVSGLGVGTLHSFAVTSIDKLGNESFISNIITTRTYLTDVTPPTPPSLAIISASDMSAQVIWSGAKDVGSDVIGYYVYLNGSLYNTQYTTDTSIIFKVLNPSSPYSVQIESFDGAFNRSAKSQVINFTTLKFNPLITSTGVKKARANIYASRYARNPGFGLNFDWSNSQFYSNVPSIFRQYIGEFKPGVLRWGDLSANSANFSTYVGTGKPVTIGKFMKLCIANDSYAEFSCGIKNNTDWFMNAATFTRFMEYLGDPTGQTSGGAQRISEGYITPLLDSLKGVIFEFGNEVWGGTSHDAEIGADYTNYAQWCREMAARIKNSPYYDSTKISLVFSGRNPDPADSYAIHSKLFAGDHHEVDGLSLSGDLSASLSYGPMPKNDPRINYYKDNIDNMLNLLSGLKGTNDQDITMTGRNRPFYFYAGNMTTPDYHGRLGQAVMMCDYFFSAEKLGVATASIYSLSGGEWSITDPNNGNARLPLFNLAELLNENTKGNILKSSIETIQHLKNVDDIEISGDPVGVHVFNISTSYAIALFSREFDSDYQVQLNLPDGQVYGNQAKKYVFTGSDYDTKTSVTNFTTEALKDSIIVTVPKYSVVLYVFDGPDLGLPLLPLGSSKYRQIEALEIVNIIGSPNINIQNGSATFSVTGIASDVVNKNVIWHISNPNNIAITVSSLSGINISSTGTCQSNGTILLKVMAAQDTTISDTVTITITNQITQGKINCNDTVAVIHTITGIYAETNIKVDIFPNPAKDIVHLRSNLPGKVIIYNVIGVKVRTYDYKATELDIDGLQSGVYILEFISDNRKIIKRVIIE